MQGQPPPSEFVPQKSALQTSHGVFGEVDALPSKEKLRRFEANAVACCFISCSAIAMDALCALPQGIEQQVPASLRCTAMCVVACLGSPIVTLDLEIEQRSVLLVLLVAAALAGEHHGQSYVRVADALFVLLSGWAIVFTFVFRAPSRPRRPAPGASLAGAFLAYVGLRAVRAGMTHASEAANFSVEAFAFETKGYALGDGVVAVAVTFGGAMLVCTGVLILFNSALVQEFGTFAISPIVAMNTSFVFVSAFVAQLSVYAHLEDLPALFSESACSGGRGSCAAAYRARRLYLANSSPASLWAGCVAATVLSMPKQRLCPSRIDYYEMSRFSTTSGAVTIMVTVVAAIAIWGFSSDDTVFAQVELLLLFLSIPVSWFGATFVACALNVAGNLLYMDQRLLGLWGFDLNYFTHWSLMVTTVLVGLLGLNTLVQRIVYMYERGIVTFDDGDSEFIAPITGVLTVSVLSIQFALTLLTLALIAGYDGALVTSETSWRTAGYEYTVQHSLTFFFTAAVYGSRYETGDLQGISTRLRRIAWYVTPLLVAIAWGVTLLARGKGSPYTEADETWGLLTGIVSAVVPWLVTGIGV
jgi:hypothetical protein